MLEEIDDRWMRGIVALADTHPHRHLVPRDDNFGIGVYSKLRFAFAEAQYWGSTVPTLRMQVEHGGRKLTIILTHPVPPRNAAATKSRNDQLAIVAEVARELGSNTIVIGDLNITQFSPHWQDFLEASGLLDSTMGRGPQATWPAHLPSICRIPIDHCLHTRDLEVTDRRRGPKFGSDHLPIVVTLR